MKTAHTKQSETVELTRDTLVLAHERAKSLGLSFSEYVQSLIDSDAQVETTDPWREPVPREVSERWEKEIAEFEEEEKINPRPGATSADELIQQLEKEAAELP